MCPEDLPSAAMPKTISTMAPVVIAAALTSSGTAIRPRNTGHVMTHPRPGRAAARAGLPALATRPDGHAGRVRAAVHPLFG
jgi:hypothetical protein